MASPPLTHTAIEANDKERIIETRLWLEEHQWLHSLFTSEHNVCPTFRFPDLISACVSLALSGTEAAERIFRYLGTELVLRDPHTPRRRASMWMPEYRLLLALQRSPSNRHPNPRFQLDQFTTACVALIRDSHDGALAVFRQARSNLAVRARRAADDRAGS